MLLFTYAAHSIGVVYTNKRMRTITHYFIINNAVADLLITIFAMPNAAKEQIMSTDTIPFGGLSGKIFCKMLVYTQDISCSSSIFTLVAIATDRFCATFFPFKRLITMKRAKWIMFGIWLASLIIPLPLFFVVGIGVDSNSQHFAYYCREHWNELSIFGTIEQLEKGYTIMVFATWYATPLIIMTVLYGAIIKKVWKRKIPGQETARAQQLQNKTKISVLRMLISVVICFAVCWLPYHFMFLFYSHDVFPPINIWTFSNFMRLANSSITPWLYVVFSKDYRRGIRNILLRCCCKKPPNEGSSLNLSTNMKHRPSERNNAVLRSYAHPIEDDTPNTI